MTISKQKLIIIGLSVALAITVIQFVVIDNYVIPSIISGNQMSFQNGYDSGTLP